MEIPKWILHPSLILAGGSLIMALVWQDWKAPPKAMPLPTKETLGLVEGISDDGKLMISGLASAVSLADARFNKPDEKQKSKMKDFFQGKFIDLSLAHTGSLPLPLAVYDPSCFEDNAPNSQKRICPLWLKP